MTEDNSNADRLYLHLKVGGTTIEVEGPAEEAGSWFEDICDNHMSKVDGSSLPESKTEPVEPQGTDDPTSESTDEGKPKTLPEYFDEVDGATKQENALFVGWYLEAENPSDDFTLDEIEETASKYKIPIGSYLSRDIRAQISKGHLDEHGERDGETTYRTTRKGELHVTDNLLSE